MMRSRRWVVAGLVVAVGVVLSGCSPEPTVMVTPRIVWQEGKRPSSELEDHPAVKVLRAATVGRALAWNSGDFTIRQLTTSYEHTSMLNVVQQYRDQGDDPWVYKGPLPFEPVKVDRLGNGDYDVIVCALPLADWTVSKPGHDWSANPSGPHLENWSVGKFDDLGLRVIGGGGSLNRSCDGSTIAVGFFDPPPVLPKGPVTEPKREPLPESR